LAALASAPVAGEAQERIEQMAVNRYRPVPDGKFSYKVVAGDGSRSLYTGTKDSCLRVAAKLTEAFLDGAFVASDAAPQASEAAPFSPDWANYRQGLEDGKAEASEAVRNAALEEAARVAESTAAGDSKPDSPYSVGTAKQAAARIRALKTQADKDGGDCAHEFPVDGSGSNRCIHCHQYPYARQGCATDTGDVHFIAGTIVMHLNCPLDPAGVMAAALAITAWAHRQHPRTDGGGHV
ncbi:MAG TPA: hypothetical protein DHL02_02945, partial [Achromobacter sp.]|nr:hypothetical protein [Achromobacter sp.]